MIVGAGLGQLPAILTAQRMGLKVVCVDKNPQALGMQYANVALSLDVIDVDGILHAAKENKIDGIMTMQSDLPVKTVGAVVSALNLPGVDKETAENCSNKIKTRECLADHNVSQPKFFVVNSVEQATEAVLEIGLPAIIKTADNSGSRGVVKINDLNDMEKSFKEAMAYSRAGKLLVEEYIEGIEFGAQAFSIDGECKRVFFHNDTMSRPPSMVPIGHSFPCNLEETKLEKAKYEVAHSLEALGVTDGPSNIDLILKKNGDVKIIEIGARIGATCLPELVSYFTGIDWVEAAILTAIGKIPDLSIRTQRPCAALVLEASTDGTLLGFKIPENVKTDLDLLEIELTAKIGDPVNKLRKGTDRIGKIFVKGRTLQQAEKKAIFLKSQVDIYVKPCD